MYTLQTKQLSHRFGNGQMAVDHINLQVPDQSIYCFLGPNGAGKTTTLRLLLGLIKPTAGTINFFPNHPSPNRVALMQRIGACIEVPSLFHHLTAVQNVAIYTKAYRTPKSRMDEVLHLLGLADAKNKKVSQFSLGMKQRLSIAIALLHQPELVILDEPTNGLDPQGIAEIRSTIIELNKNEKITFLISSHLLSEVEKLATHVGIIHKGQMKFQGTMTELYQASSKAAKLILSTDNDEAAMQLIATHFDMQPIASGALIYSSIDQSLSLKINRMLHDHRIGVSQLQWQDNDLETHFLRLIQNPTI
jgi:ABC-2 type transport system ATP-binding protein